MGVRNKIVALMIAILTALIPLSHMACPRGTCHPRSDSSSMACHAMHNPESHVVLESKVDHLCCRLAPALPASARYSLQVQKFELQLSSPVSKDPADALIPEGALGVLATSSPPRWPPQPHSCVLQI
jgi:hypothetical protein